MARKRTILGDLSITFTFKLVESRRDTDRPAALRAFNTEKRKEKERGRDLSHLRQRQPRHLGQAAAANLSHCNCNSATEVIRPVSPLFFSFTVQHSCCLGFFTFFRSPCHAPSVISRALSPRPLSSVDDRSKRLVH